MIWAPATTLPISPIFKVPLLVTSAALAQAGWTPPTPIPDPNETAKYGIKPEDSTKQIVIRRVATVGRGVFWTYALCEAATVLANAYPSSLSDTVLSYLVRDGYQASNIRFTPVWLVGCLAMGIGGAIRIRCHRELGKFFTWELTVKKDQKLITSGPYSVVRHPSYTGMTLKIIGFFLCHLGPGAWARECGWLDTTVGKVAMTVWLGYCTAVNVMLLRRLPVEDAVLRKEFGQEWDAWSKRTPYRLIPLIY